ncbi:MAG: IS630 transposase-related protein [Cyanobacteria bacterium P01_F01_bin.153]
MSYSLDLRQRVIDAVRNGSSVTTVSQTFQVSRATTYRWLARPKLAATVVKKRRRKIAPEALLAHVRQYPEPRLKDRAAHFNVHPSAIGRRLQHLGIT